jgi:hypothetical protein
MRFHSGTRPSGTTTLDAWRASWFRDVQRYADWRKSRQANRFCEGVISEHLQIGIEAMMILRCEGPALHSRKLRAFDEPPFR